MTLLPPNLPPCDLFGDGPPLVLLHSFPVDRTIWRPVAERLADAHSVILPDLRGFGESRLAEDSRADITHTMEDHARDVIRRLDHLGITEPVVLCGLSLGGYVALAIAEQSPERVARVILCGSRAAADSPEKQSERRRTAKLVQREGTGFLIDALAGQQLAGVNQADAALTAGLRQMAERASRSGVAAALRGMAERPDRTAVLQRLAVPTLLVCGAEDRITPPEEMQALAGSLPNARFVVIPRAGHLAPWEHPEATANALRRFLSEGS